jgi:hypothetical protein
MAPPPSKRYLALMESLEQLRSKAEARIREREQSLEDWREEEAWLRENTNVLREWKAIVKDLPLPARYVEPFDEVMSFGRRSERAIRSHPGFKRLDREWKAMFRELSGRDREGRRIAEGPEVGFWVLVGAVLLALACFAAWSWLGR